jgi:hypothetical protein
MMTCTGWRLRYLLSVLLLGLAILPAVGCTALLTTVAIMFWGDDIDAEYAGLKGKEVAVVCRPPTDLKYQDSHVGKDLARELSRLLKEKVKNIKIVDPHKAERWADEHNWDEYQELGKAVGAEMVVGIDLDHFEMYSGQTMYQGKANLSIHVYQCKWDAKAKKKADKDGKLPSDPDFEKALIQVVYPRNNFIQTSEMPEPMFRSQFIKAIADKIGQCFYAHDKAEDFAPD